MAHANAPTKNKVKRTYVLSAPILERFEAKVAPGKRGVAVDAAIDHWLEAERLAEIRARMEEFYDDQESQALYAQIDRECSPASDELWAAIPDDEEWPEPVIVFPHGYAAYLAQSKQPREKKTDGK